MDKPFEIFDHTADIGIIAYGADINELFANAALGLFSLMVDVDTLKEDVEHVVELSAEDNESLLVEWLNELIYIFDVEHIAFKRFEIDRLKDNAIRARCFGERIDPQRHRVAKEIKAATYHMLQINRENSIYQARIIFDI